MVQAREYLDQHYPKENRRGLYELDLSNLNLIGDLDLGGFLSLELININGNPELGKVTVNNGKSGVLT